MAVKAFATDARAEFKDLTFDTLMESCLANGHKDWLEEAMTRKMEHYKFQKVTVTDANGKKRKVIDKTLPKVLEYRKPTFIELKEMYLTEICGIPAAVKKAKPLTMEERLALRIAEMEGEVVGDK